MTTQDKLVKRKLSLLELAEFLKNVSQAFKINSASRQHFYDIKKAGPFLTLRFKFLIYCFFILGFSLLSSPLLRSFPDLRSGICAVYEN